MMEKYIFSFFVSLTLLSCTPKGFTYKEIDLTEFHNYGITPLQHTIYMGSDKEFHYFSWSNGKQSGKWKLSIQTLKLSCVLAFPYNNGTFIMKKDAYIYEPLACKSS